MSTEARLKRLGLYHLKDKPEELEKELNRQIEEDHKNGLIPNTKKPTYGEIIT